MDGGETGTDLRLRCKQQMFVYIFKKWPCDFTKKNWITTTTTVNVNPENFKNYQMVQIAGAASILSFTIEKSIFFKNKARLWWAK